LLVGSSLVLVSGALAAGAADPITGISSDLELAQAHEHRQEGGGEHAPSTPAPPPSPERPPRREQPAPEGSNSST
jgi:hypothetical protein